MEKILQSVLPFWERLSETEKEILTAGACAVHYGCGQTVHGGGTHCTGGVLVQSGVLRAYIMSDEGREITLYRLYPGDICMLSASCVLKSVTFDVMVDAGEESDCILLNGGAFAAVTDRNVYAENFALNIAVERFSDVMWILQQILFMSFDRRLAIFLHDEAIRTGSNTLRLTHEQIAKYTGSAREVVSRMLKYFESEEVVSLFRGGVTITDLKKLKHLTGEH